MKKRQFKKNTKTSMKVYRGIRIMKNYMGEYQRGQWRVMILFPEIEHYSKNTSGVRSYIDQYFKNNPERDLNEDIPF